MVEISCPSCPARFTPGPGDPVPQAGAMTICMGCRAVGVFVDGPFGLIIRAATDEELAAWAADPRTARLVAAVLDARANPRRPGRG